jgi:YVTN family beta-propeller protein
VAFGAGALWVANETTGTVSRIDPATNTVVATIPTLGNAEGVATGAGAVWVANYGTPGKPDGVLSRIDPATNQVVATVPVGGNPVYVAFGGGFAWVALWSESTVVQVNATTNIVQSRISSGILVLGASGKILGLHGIAAGDHSVWAVQPLPVDQYYALPGTLVRINY